MSIRGIFFDAGGVLYQRISPTADFALRLLEERHFHRRPGDVESRELEIMRGRASEGGVSHQAYWQRFLILHGVEDAVQREIMIGQITDFSNDVQAVPDCPEALAELRRRGFRLGIVTDTIYPLEWKMKRLEKAGVAHLIDVVACSSALGVHKPDPAIYLDALRQAGMTPGESAFVGHDPTELGGASLAGLVTVAVRYTIPVKADYYCETMVELLDMPLFQTAEPVMG